MRTITLHFKEDYFIDKIKEDDDYTGTGLEAVIKNVFLSFLLDIEVEKILNGVKVDLPLNISLFKEHIDTMEELKVGKKVIAKARESLKQLIELHENSQNNKTIPFRRKGELNDK